VDVRRARAADAEAIAMVHVRAWQEAFPGLVPQAYLDALSVEERTATWASTLAETDGPRLGTFVLEDDGAVVGFVHLRPSRDDDVVAGVGDGQGEVGEVVTLYLRASAWGGGGGRALLEGALDEFRRGGFAWATLWVLATNDRARRFYESCGWEADGAEKQHDWGAFTARDVRYRTSVARPDGRRGDR